MSKKNYLENARINERSRNLEAIRIYKRNRKIFHFVTILFISYAIYMVLFIMRTGDSFSLFINPFEADYLKKNWWVTLILFVLTVVLYLFHFGNGKRIYIKRLEFLKQKIFNFFNFYIDGNDERNLYLRFGLKDSLMNGFLLRCVRKKDYLKKAKLNIFSNKYHPNDFFKFNVNGKIKSIDFKKYFHSENDYIELFQIIEGYLKNNIDVKQNISLKNYLSFNSINPAFTIESFDFYLNLSKIQNKKILKNAREDFIKILETAPKNEKKQQLESLIRKYFKDEGFKDYTIAVKQMVSFSVKALQEFLNFLYVDVLNFYTKCRVLENKAYQNLITYHRIDNEELDKLLEYMVFCYFFKIINQFMGLPSGIVTARIKDYSFARVIDDLEHFENSRGIRLIKKQENDQFSKFDDTFARAFMILYHEYKYNSINKDKVQLYIQKFNPLLSVDILDNMQLEEKNKEWGNNDKLLNLSNSIFKSNSDVSFGAKPQDNYVPHFDTLEELERRE